jgi:ABC-2 type transport system permease protein
MKNFLQSKFWWILPTCLFVAIAIGGSLLHTRLDLTAEKRYSLSASTRTLLSKLDTVINVEIFLAGDLPNDYRKLANATAFLLDEFKNYAGSKLQVKFTEAGAGLKSEEAKMQLFDSLAQLGVVFERSKIAGMGKEENTPFILPSALVKMGNYRPIAVDLRSSRKIYKSFNIETDVPEEDIEATRNAAEALLEYKFANALDKLTRTKIPTIAYVTGNGQPIDKKVNDLGESLRNDYQLGVFNLKAGWPNPKQIEALLLIKPTESFSDLDKLKLDQYVMNGGKIIWCIDKLHAELDSLMRTQGSYVAFDRGLNLDDLLFTYGVRINADLVQDLNCSKIPLVYGYNPDGSPKMQRLPWPYYPLLSGSSRNPISTNLDRVLPIFPSSIDTVKANGIQKTVLLATDTNSKVISTPLLVSINEVVEGMQNEFYFKQFAKSHVPIAVLLEGKFQSLFANRLTQSLNDSLQAATGTTFLQNAANAGSQIVISDADLFMNTVSSGSGPLEMGMLPFENYRFANKEFLLNCIDYLVGENRLFESRNKDFILRLLDKEKVENQQQWWQVINLVLPLLILLFTALFFTWKRKVKYARA